MLKNKQVIELGITKVHSSLPLEVVKRISRQTKSNSIKFKDLATGLVAEASTKLKAKGRMD